MDSHDASRIADALESISSMLYAIFEQMQASNEKQQRIANVLDKRLEAITKLLDVH